MKPKTEKIANPATKLDPPFTKQRTNVSLRKQTNQKHQLNLVKQWDWVKNYTTEKIVKHNGDKVTDQGFKNYSITVLGTTLGKVGNIKGAKCKFLPSLHS